LGEAFGFEMKITRPVWQQFSEEKQAILYANKGGGAVWKQPGSAPRLLLFRADRHGSPEGLFLWVLFALGVQEWEHFHRGERRGLVGLEVPGSHQELVDDWLKRDEPLSEPTHAQEFDCLACGACCHMSRVLLTKQDLQNWVRNDRFDLIQPRYIQMERHLPLLKPRADGACQHLNGKACTIYEIRPENCEAFEAGSELCQYVRKEAGVS
jgi:uncharacterized protein